MPEKSPFEKIQEVVTETVRGIAADPAGAATKAAEQVRGAVSLGLTMAGQAAQSIAERLNQAAAPPPPPSAPVRPTPPPPAPKAAPDSETRPDAGVEGTAEMRPKPRPPAKKTAPPAKKAAAKKTPTKKAAKPAKKTTPSAKLPPKKTPPKKS